MSINKADKLQNSFINQLAFICIIVVLGEYHQVFPGKSSPTKPKTYPVIPTKRLPISSVIRFYFIFPQSISSFSTFMQCIYYSSDSILNKIHFILFMRVQCKTNDSCITEELQENPQTTVKMGCLPMRRSLNSLEIRIQYHCCNLVLTFCSNRNVNCILYLKRKFTSLILALN